jgi:hypothetical protein
MELHMIEYTDYRLALVLPQSRQLLGIASFTAPELPIVRVPLWERPAEQLTKQIEARWKITAIILDILPGQESDSPCAVGEVRTDSWDFESEGFDVTQPAEVSDISLADSQRHSLETILLGIETSRGAFSRIGWIEEAQRWIQASIDDHRVTFTNEIRQLNGGGTFCLLRLGTQSGAAYWIKGVGDPNVDEFAITGFLARHCPEYLPPVVAMRSDWNAWVMEEFGSSLHDSDSPDDFRRAACRLGDLQRALSGKSEELLAARCADHRSGVLNSRIDEIIDYLDGAMRQQSSTGVAPLTTARLHEIRSILHSACRVLEELRIPDSIMHGDISPGSILSNGDNCLFTDWCEAYVGCPFITFEQFCVHVARKNAESGSWIPSLRSIYKSCWLDVLTESQLEIGFQLSPLISVLSNLYGRGDWLQSPKRHEDSFMGYARSLARHMDRIARTPGLTEVLCRRT